MRGPLLLYGQDFDRTPDDRYRADLLIERLEEEKGIDRTADAEALMERLRKCLAMLPPRELDYIELYIGLGIKQPAIGRIFGVTQSGVSLRIRRALDRLRFMLEVGTLISVDDIRRDLVEHPPPDLFETFVAYWSYGWAVNSRREDAAQ